MRTQTLYARVVTFVTFVALFAITATPALGLRTCMERDASAAQQPHQNHSGNHEAGGTSIPCPHGALGGLCAAAVMPATNTTFSSDPDGPQVARVADELRPHSVGVAAVFHPPRF